MRTAEVYELECWACRSYLVIATSADCCPDCGAELAIEWGPKRPRRRNRRNKGEAMYTIQKHRINLDLIAFVEIGEESLHVNGPGADIVLDRNTDPNATHALLIDLREVRSWLPANGKLVNPAHIITMTCPEHGVLKVNVAGTEIWVSEREELKGLMNHHAGLFSQPLYPSASQPPSEQEAA